MTGPWTCCRGGTPLALIASLVLAAGCASEVELALEPDPAASGADGERGPFGVARASWWTQGRVSDGIRHEVSWPADADGVLDPTGAPYPAVVLVQGGLVKPERYRWLAVHLASRGYVVSAAKHSANLAILESDNASLALDDLIARAGDPAEVLAGAVDGEAAAAAIGHSLGGVVGSMRWVDDPRIDGVALLASYAAGSTDVEAMEGHPSILLTGSEDRVEPAVFVEEYARYPEPRWFGVGEGMNHYDWTDDATDGELDKDGASTRPLEETRRDGWRVLDSWFDAHLRDDAEAAARLAAGGFPGVEETP